MMTKLLVGLTVIGFAAVLLIATVSANAPTANSLPSVQSSAAPTTIPSERLARLGITVTAPLGSAGISAQQAEASALKEFPDHSVGLVMFAHIKNTHRQPVDEGDRWIVMMSPLTSEELPSGPPDGGTQPQETYLLVEIDAQSGAFVAAIGG